MRLMKVLFPVFDLFAFTLYSNADTLNFTLTDGGDTYTFSLPSNPTPNMPSSNQFSLFSIPVSEDGDSPVNSALVFFANPGNFGGFHISFPFVVLVMGPQVFTGTTAAPVFSPGDFTFTGGSELQITEPTPEPTAILLLGTGVLGMAGTMARRLRQ